MIDFKSDQTCIKQIEFWENFYGSGKEFALMVLIQFKDRDEWLQSLSRGKRYDYRKSIKLNYISKPISMAERNEYLKDIYEVNISSKVRQGREMDNAYWIYPNKMTEREQCKEHYTQFFGCFLKDKLVAYSNIHVTGEIASISMLLGHAFHQKQAGIMINLFQSIISYLIERKVRYLAYHHWDSGTPGLQQFKSALLFKPTSL